MNPIYGKTIEDAEADVGGSETSEGYTCVQPEEGILIFDWLNDSASEAVEAQLVTRHLKLCLHCREAVANWRFLHGSVKAAHPRDAPVTAEDEEPEVASKAAKSTETGLVEETDLVELKAISHHGGN